MWAMVVAVLLAGPVDVRVKAPPEALRSWKVQQEIEKVKRGEQKRRRIVVQGEDGRTYTITIKH